MSTLMRQQRWKRTPNAKTKKQGFTHLYPLRIYNGYSVHWPLPLTRGKSQYTLYIPQKKVFKGIDGAQKVCRKIWQMTKIVEQNKVICYLSGDNKCVKNHRLKSKLWQVNKIQ